MAWGAVAVLTLSWFLPFAAFVTLFALAIGLAAANGPNTLLELKQPVEAIAVIWALHLVFVSLVFAFRVVVNAITGKRRSPFVWALGGWILSIFSEVAVTRHYVEVSGAQVGLALWFSTGCALCSVSFALVLSRVLWSWSSRSVIGAQTVIAAAVVIVLLPIGAWAGTSQLTHKSLTPRPPGVPALAAGPPTADGGSPYDACLAQLKGDECRGVWQRAINEFGLGDEVQKAFIDVCIKKELSPPRVCGAFYRKVERLRIDAWRYSRRFRDDPTLDDPPCALPTDDDAMMSQAELDNLDHAQAHLEHREQKIIDLAYAKDQTDAEIAAELGLSAVHVGRLRRAIQKKLKANLESCQ